MKLLFLFTCLLLCMSFRFQANFHEIDKNKFYRAGQLNEKELKEVISKYKIKTIINLRGEFKGSDWYKVEERLSQENNIDLVNIHMSAKYIPHKAHLIKLLNTFETAERPILLHCKAGADRTGEASAIYQMEYMGKSKKQSMKMMTLKYHHLAIFKPAKRYFIKKVWKGVEWAKTNYDPCLTNYKYYKKDPAHCF